MLTERRKKGLSEEQKNRRDEASSRLLSLLEKALKNEKM